MSRYRSVFVKRAVSAGLVSGVLSACILFVPVLRAQKAELQERIADLKESMAKNKQELAQYTWIETQTVYLKGEQKKQQHFQVRMGPDGKPQKTSIDPAPAQEQGGHKGGKLKQHVIEKKKEEYEEYAERMKSLISRYVPPDKDTIQSAFSAGNVSIAPDSGGGDLVKMVIKNYVKSGDSVSLTFDKGQKMLAQYAVATYLDDPSDAIKLTVNFDRIPGGPSHVAQTIVESTGKQIKIDTENAQYNKL
jgi:hypothetical protein